MPPEKSCCFRFEPPLRHSLRTRLASSAQRPEASGRRAPSYYQQRQRSYEGTAVHSFRIESIKRFPLIEEALREPIHNPPAQRWIVYAVECFNEYRRYAQKDSDDREGHGGTGSRTED